MKSMILIMALIAGINANAFYCADGGAKFRVAFTDENGQSPKMEDLKDGMLLYGDFSMASKMNFDNKEDGKIFKAKVYDYGEETLSIYYVDQTEDGEEIDGSEILNIEISKKSNGYITVGGQWNIPDSGIKSPVFPVISASYITVDDNYVGLDDVFEKEMNCWWTGNLATLE